LKGTSEAADLKQRPQDPALASYRRAVQVHLGGPRQGQNLLAYSQQLPLSLAHQRHKHFPHAPALSAKAAHPPLEVLLELARLRLERCAL
jgi:hypothetical protein